MRVLYQVPSLESIYAIRTIYHGYKNAFEDFGHIFQPMVSSSNCKEMLDEFKPNILITSMTPYYLKYLNLKAIKKHKERGMVVFVATPFWRSLLKKNSIIEGPGLLYNKKYIKLIISNNFGDIYYNVFEPEDPRMYGFEKTTGYKHYTIPLAADKIVLKGQFEKKFEADISYVGTYSPKKKHYFKKNIFHFRKKYDVKIYGQDWNFFNRSLSWIQRGGQYFNVPFLKAIRKPKLKLCDEAKIYKSSKVSINVHEESQRQFGGDCNERTFKIPLCGGFEITDDVYCIRKYFIEGKEIVIAKDFKDWDEKIEYYIKNPDKRIAIIKSGKRKVLTKHTYHNRVNQIIDIYNKVKK